MKFCKDCKHIENGFTDAPPRCYHPAAERFDPITGKQANYFCEVMRAGGGIGDCGTDAALFEPKQSTPEREL